MTAICFIPRLVMIVAVPQGLLLIHTRIAVARIVALVDRQGCPLGNGKSIPTVPPPPALVPVSAPMVTPTRRRLAIPPEEISRWPSIIEHRDSQQEIRHPFRIDQIPRAVIPGTGVPVILHQ